MSWADELVRLAIAQGGFAIIAVLIFLAYRKDVKGTADVLIQVVRENTASNTELIGMVRALHARLDGDAPVAVKHRDRS